MAETVVNLYEAKTRLSLLVERAAAGETIVIAKAGRPMARLVPVRKGRRIRLGSLRGRIRVPDDFDRLASDEIEAMFGGR
ncbi:MAG: type II toxin-antitoxin system prevent-host-death family antitoxin [Burkholderiales bacterium]|nr:type II toxin-antitoxin system prevent-host-death family antitoxin [Burkholderiales bacterium]